MHLYCVGCKSHQECSNPQHSVSANGRAMVKATCPHGHTCCSFKGMASGAQGEGLKEDVMHKLGKVYNTQTEKWQKLPSGMPWNHTVYNGRLGRHEIHMTPTQLAEWEFNHKRNKGTGAQGEGFMDFIKPLVKPLLDKAKEKAIEVAKKKAEELAKAAAEALVTKAADKLKEKMQAKKGGKMEMGALRTPASEADWEAANMELARRRVRKGKGLAPAPSQMSASQLASIKKKMRNL